MTWTDTPASSTISGHGYEGDTKTLTVKFKSGGTYTYHDVPQSLYDQMKSASSVGSFHAKNVKSAFRNTKT